MLIALFLSIISLQSSAEKAELVANLNLNQSTESAMCYSNKVEYKGKLYFCADKGNLGQELYVFEGNSQQVYLVADINAGEQGSSPSQLYVYNGKLYFVANDGTHGRELFVYDAATNNVTLVADINEGNGSESNDRSHIRNLVNYHGKLYFSASNGTNPRTIFEYNDSTHQITRLSILPNDVSLSSSYGAMVEYGGKLYFTALIKGESGYYSIFKIFGWQQGNDVAQLLHSDLVGVSHSWPNLLTVYGDKLYFAEAGINGNSAKLHSFSVNGNEIELVVDLPLASAPKVLFLNDSLYFSGVSEGYGHQIFQFNSTSGELKRITSYGRVDEFISYDGNVYFGANFAVSGEYKLELYELNAYNNEVKLITSEYTGVYESAPSDLISFNGQLFFSASHGFYGRELFSYNSSDKSVELVVDINTNVRPSDPYCFTELNNSLYFFARNANRFDSSALYKVDLGSKDIELVYDVNESEYIGAANFCLMKANGKLFFFVDRDEISMYGNHVMLYQYDPVTKKGGKVIAIDEIFGYWDAGRIRIQDNKLYINSHYAGTIEYDTVTETKINFASASTPLRFMDNKLYSIETYGNKLYSFDLITKEKTYILPEQLSSVSSLAVYKGNLYFAALVDEGVGKELYTYNPATNELSLVKDYYAGKNHSYPTGLTVKNNLLNFKVTQGDSVGLYIFDGENAPAIVEDFYSFNDEQIVCRIFSSAYNGKSILSIKYREHGNCELHLYNDQNQTYQVISNTIGEVSSVIEIQDENQIYFFSKYNEDNKYKTIFYHYDSLTGELIEIHNHIYSYKTYGSGIYFRA